MYVCSLPLPRPRPACSDGRRPAQLRLRVGKSSDQHRRAVGRDVRDGRLRRSGLTRRPKPASDRDDGGLALPQTAINTRLLELSF
jgi:hypothetical protein